MHAGVATIHHLIVEHLCQPHHTKLGGTVVRQLTQPHDSCRAGHVDHMAVVPLQHGGQEELGCLWERRMS